PFRQVVLTTPGDGPERGGREQRLEADALAVRTELGDPLDGTRALERVVQVGRESSAAAVERVAARIVAALVPSEGVVAAPHLRRRLAPSGPRRRVAAAESEQPSNPGEGPLGNGEARAYALKKRLEVRGVAP